MSDKFVSFLRSDEIEAIQIREWLRINRSDLKIENVISISFSIEMKITYPHLDLPDTKIGSALLTFAVNEYAREIVYIPMLGIYKKTFNPLTTSDGIEKES